MFLAERRTKAMGSTAQVIVYAPTQPSADDLADLALLRVNLLEQCWSRFRDDSELNALNAHAGQGPVEVSADLETLVSVMLEAAEWTQGAFDPTVLGAMTNLGYDADFATVVARDAIDALNDALAPVHGTGGIVLDSHAHTVCLPSGVGLDPGAIGKGLAGDIVASEIYGAGAQGVLVNLGGDITTRGEAGWAPWVAQIADDRRTGSPLLHEVQLSTGRRSVATSSSLRRRWNGRHHVIDPVTGLPAQSDLAQVTVIAPTGWQAEAATTFALVRGRDEAGAWLADHHLDALLFPHDPTIEPIRVREALHV